jgi:hypothetical protein
MNRNWFFDGLNYQYRNKVWGTKNTRWGEIWWFYPRGSDTECNDAIIYNYREDTWYDAHLTRSAGDAVQTFQYPIWTGAEDSRATKLLTVGLTLATDAATVAPSMTLNFASTTGVANGMVVSGASGIPYGSTVSSHTGTTAVINNATTADVASGAIITFTTMTTDFVNGSTVTGGTSGATGTAVRVALTGINVINITGTFQNGETITGNNGANATIIAAPQDQQLDTVYQQEFGNDKVVDATVSAIRSSFTSCNFGIAVGDPFMDVPKAPNINTIVKRVEPDLNQSGDVTIAVNGRPYANSSQSVVQSLTSAQDDGFVDFDAQERILTMTVESNTEGGFYELGQMWIELQQGSEMASGQ